jgi:hypothetical protein
MNIKQGKINPLNALDIRKVHFPAYHFHYTELPKFHPVRLKNLDEWIYHNLNGRYYIGSSISLIDNNITYITRIGFEVEKEISFFKIACPFINQ